MRRVSPLIKVFMALGLFAAATGCDKSKQQAITTFDGNWRVQLRTSVNGQPSVAQSGNSYVELTWNHDTSYVAGSHSTVAGYTDSQAYIYGTSGSYNSVWSGYSGFCDGFGTLEDSGAVSTGYKSTSFLTCDVSEGSFYFYSSGHSGYLASSVPGDWTDQSGNVAGPGDAGTLPPPSAPLPVAVSAAESPSDDDMDSPGGTSSLVELSASDLYPDDYIDSPDGTLRLLYQDDGNLVIYDMTTSPWSPLWSTGTAGDSTGQTSMQGDGNLVVYNGSSSPVWSSGTDGNDGAYLVLLDTGDLMVLRTDGFALWWSASGSGRPSPASLSSASITSAESAHGSERQASLRRERPLVARPY